MEKFNCCKCNNMAVWFYMPSDTSRTEAECYYCNEHILRGCSCNYNYQTEQEDTDEEGRLYPCCEYCFNDEGFEIIIRDLASEKAQEDRDFIEAYNWLQDLPHEDRAKIGILIHRARKEGVLW